MSPGLGLARPILCCVPSRDTKIPSIPRLLLVPCGLRLVTLACVAVRKDNCLSIAPIQLYPGASKDDKDFALECRVALPWASTIPVFEHHLFDLPFLPSV